MTQPTLMMTEYDPQVGDVLQKDGVQIIVDIVRNEVFFRRWGKGQEVPAFLRTPRTEFVEKMLTEQPQLSRVPPVY